MVTLSINPTTTKLAGNVDVGSLLNPPLSFLFQTIQEEHRQNQALNNERKNKMYSKLERFAREYDASRIQYLEEALCLLKNAVETPVDERGSIHSTWKHILNIHGNDCRNIICSILRELRTWKQDANYLKCNYFASSIGLYGGCILPVGGIVLCKHNTIFNFQSNYVVGGIVLLIGWCSCLYLVNNRTRRELRAHQQCVEEIQSCMDNYYSNLEEQSQTLTTTQVADIPDDTFDPLKINDVTWSNNILLQSLCRIATKLLKSTTAEQ